MPYHINLNLIQLQKKQIQILSCYQHILRAIARREILDPPLLSLNKVNYAFKTRLNEVN